MTIDGGDADDYDDNGSDKEHIKTNQLLIVYL